ncbi:MAG: anti-sigma factor [Terriglobales bacterium]
MKCNEINEQLMDAASGEPVEAAVAEHVATCLQCGQRLQSLRQTMSLLEEWKAPEPSPYFDTRLQARLREEAARPQGIFAWLRRPVLAGAMAVLMTAAIATFYHGSGNSAGTAAAQAEPGTAVGDLQSLDKNHDLYANFDVLDDLEDIHPASQTANP